MDPTPAYSKWWLPINISTHGGEVDTLINYLHVFMAALFIGWGIFFIYCLVKFRDRPGATAQYQPVSGKLSGFNVEVGQSIERGGRIGQIDDPDDFKLRASIDEFYLGRVAIGQAGSFDRSGSSYQPGHDRWLTERNAGHHEVAECDADEKQHRPEGNRTI